MANKTFKVLTDSACDMPYDLEKQSGVDILSFTITVDGKLYTERQDFDFDQYYDILRNCQGIPSTAHITTPRYLEKFEAYDDAGIQQVLYVSICASGSNTHDAAVMAKKTFHEERPGSKMEIFIVDSHCYSMAYGWYVAEAVRRLNAGEAMQDVVAWLENDIFTSAEILLAAYSLKFMKKSGRISAAAAFAGELLGLRPVITLNDGVSTVQKKVRGDKEVHPAMLDYARGHMRGDFYMVGGTHADDVEELARLCTAEFGTPPKATFKLGAAVATNTGPDAIAIVYMGDKRR